MPSSKIRRIDLTAASPASQMAALRKLFANQNDKVTPQQKKRTQSVFGEALTPAQAVIRARELAGSMAAGTAEGSPIVEVEVDTLEQLAEVLAVEPDIVLLDNMPPEVLRRAVALRDELAPAVELEASGGVSLASVAAIAATGVERISVGALTHSAESLDVGLDWR